MALHDMEAILRSFRVARRCWCRPARLLWLTFVLLISYDAADLQTSGAFGWEDGDYAVRCWRQAAGVEVVAPTPAAASCSTTVVRVHAVRQSFGSGRLERIASRAPVHPARSQIVSPSSDKPTEEASN
jgi:hypothetical protein